MSTNEKPNGVNAEILDGDEILEETAENEAAEAEVVELDPLALAQAQAEEYKNLAQRTRAELENYRRRTNKEREDLLRFGSERVLTEMLSILDDVERAQEHALDESPLSEGFRMLLNALQGMMQRNDVTEVPGVGSAFDPSVHNAIANVDAEGLEKGQVAMVYQKGYFLHDRLIRPAMVAVANG